jgi:KaiC/GvpD/RAD55 family RecA-like ATPase
MVTTGLRELDELLNNSGYPERSTILVAGPPGIGKEALGYWFLSSGLSCGDFCIYVTTLSVSEVEQDLRAFHIDIKEKRPFWIASDGGELKCDVNDLSALSFNIKEVLKKNADKRIRVVTDVLSSLLILNPPDTIYRFLTQLFSDIKQYDAVFLATIDEGMHAPNILAAMAQRFDGMIELKLYEKGMRLIPLLRINKMRGMPPQPTYFNFNFTQNGIMEISPVARLK